MPSVGAPLDHCSVVPEASTQRLDFGIIQLNERTEFVTIMTDKRLVPRTMTLLLPTQMVALLLKDADGGDVGSFIP
jgi:hypothetical protein